MWCLNMITRPNWARKVHEMIIGMGQNNRRYGKVFFYIPEKGRRGKYLKKEIIFLQRRRNRVRYHGEGKYLRWKTEKEKEGNIYRKRLFLCRGEEKLRRERRKIFGEGKYFVCTGEEWGGKYLSICLCGREEERKRRKTS